MNREKVTAGIIFYQIVKWTVYFIWALHGAAIVYFAITDLFILLLWLIWCVTGAPWGYILILMAKWKCAPTESVLMGGSK